MNILEDLDNLRIQIGGAILEMKYIFDEGKLKRVTTRSHGDHFVTRIQTFHGMDCGNENITEEKEETNMSTENLEIFKRNFTSHFGGPGDYIHSSIQGLVGSNDNNRQPSYVAESEDSEESGESEDSWESDESEESLLSEESTDSQRESEEPEDSEEIQRIINARWTSSPKIFHNRPNSR